MTSIFSDRAETKEEPVLLFQDLLSPKANSIDNNNIATRLIRKNLKSIKAIRKNSSNVIWW